MFSFCKPVSSKKRFLPHRKINDDFNFTLFASAQDIPAKEWQRIIHNRTFFLDVNFLRILEDSGHSRLSCRYVIVYHGDKPCGILYFQIIDFKAGIFGSLISSQVETIRDKKLNLFERYIDSNKEEVLLRLFTCGNNLISGEYGFLFNLDIPAETSTELMLHITDIIAKEEKLRGTISAILLKDFHIALEPDDLLEDERYSKFFVDPNMVVNLPSNIKNLNDYISHFSKKYRNRAKTIFKNLSGIVQRDLSVQDLSDIQHELFPLYEQIFQKAKFRLLKLPADYFLRVKQLFPEQYKVTGFFKDGRLVAFASCFTCPDQCLEAHYIGFDYAENAEHDLYQNILYAMISEGIKNNCSTVNLGRTASEIKTTVGAKPVELICYIKPQNTISRLIQRPFISFLQPQAWTPRNPFKEEMETEAK